MPTRKKKAEFIRFNTIKEHIIDVLKMRSSDTAVNKLIKDFDSTIEDVIAEAASYPKKISVTPLWSKILPLP